MVVHTAADVEDEGTSIPSGEGFEYEKTRDFSYKTTEAKESYVLFVRSNDGVYYNQIADQIRLAKRRDKKVDAG